MISPLQQGFDSDSEACFSITVHYLPAVRAFEHGIIGTAMSVSQSTAVATPFACMPAIHSIEIDTLIKTSALKQLFELIKRDAHNLFVSFSANAFESLQVFNRNIGIVLKSHVRNFIGNFTQSILNKVSLLYLHFSEGSDSSMTAFISEGLKFLPSLKDLFTLNPDILPEVGLFENSTIRGNNACSKTFEIYIYTEYIFPLRERNIRFREICNNLSIGCESICLALPSIFNERDVFVIIPILLDGNSYPSSRIYPQFHKEVCSGAEGFTISRVIEFDGDVLEFIPLTLDDVPLNITNNLRTEGGAGFAI